MLLSLPVRSNSSPSTTISVAPMNNGAYPFVSTSWVMMVGAAWPAYFTAAFKSPFTSIVPKRDSHSSARRASGTRPGPIIVRAALSALSAPSPTANHSYGPEKRCPTIISPHPKSCGSGALSRPLLAIRNTFLMRRGTEDYPPLTFSLYRCIRVFDATQKNFKERET